MHAARTHDLARRPVILRPPQPAVAPPPHIVSPEVFRERVETELLRHNRYLEPVGLLRLGPRIRHQDADGLRESVWLEVRQTDSACLLPDGSWALLALYAGERQLRIIVRRLMDAAAEIELERGDDPIDLVAALSSLGDRRVEAAMMWLALSRTFEDCRSGNDTVVVVR